MGARLNPILPYSSPYSHPIFPLPYQYPMATLPPSLTLLLCYPSHHSSPIPSHFPGSRLPLPHPHPSPDVPIITHQPPPIISRSPASRRLPPPLTLLLLCPSHHPSPITHHPSPTMNVPLITPPPPPHPSLLYPSPVVLQRAKGYPPPSPYVPLITPLTLTLLLLYPSYHQSFPSEQEAARAYDRAAVLVYGRGTAQNFHDQQFQDFPVNEDADEEAWAR